MQIDKIGKQVLPEYLNRKHVDLIIPSGSNQLKEYRRREFRSKNS